MHKFGHYYLPEGRALVLAISRFINTLIYKSLFSASLSLQLLPNMTHTAFAQAFSRTVLTRSVYVYDKGILVAGSPFSSYTDALRAIKVNPRSSAIKRAIDTGKPYLDRYTFYSTRQD